jgi:L-lysine exporter family protein LysE/ArgO
MAANAVADVWLGLSTGLALIVAIGSQNAYVLRQGIRREHVLALVVFCALSDALLIVAGVGGMGALVVRNPVLQELTRYGGALFLGAYALLAAWRAWRGGQALVVAGQGVSLRVALATCFAFTFLNPHVYLDTVVLLGTVASQRGDGGRWWFALGACCGSVLWFSALGFGARWLAPLFAKALAWRVLDGLIALVMGAMAWALWRG